MFILALLILGSFIIAFGSFLNALLFCIVWIAMLVLLGIFLGKKYGSSIDSTMESVMHIGVIGGILCGIAMVVIGFFKDAGYETSSYQDWHGNTITYITNRISNIFYLGFVVFALAFTIMFLYFAYFMAKDKYVPEADRIKVPVKERIKEIIQGKNGKKTIIATIVLVLVIGAYLGLGPVIGKNNAASLSGQSYSCATGGYYHLNFNSGDKCRLEKVGMGTNFNNQGTYTVMHNTIKMKFDDYSVTLHIKSKNSNKIPSSLTGSIEGKSCEFYLND